MAGESKSAPTEVYADDFIGAWRAQANCLDKDPGLFFPVDARASEEKVQEALGICAVCVVRPECLNYALETNQQAGIWGGYEEDERRSLRKRWLAEKRRYATRST
jgi:WhiB family redox-sensing transcriptional regulator